MLPEKAKPEETGATRLETSAGSDTTFIIFGGISQGMGMPPFEFRRVMETVPANRIYVRDIRQAWYQDYVAGDEAFLDSLLGNVTHYARMMGDHRTVFIGNSMGGFAALLLGILAGADRILAFAPQTFVDPLNRLRYNDRRWYPDVFRMYWNFGFFRKSYDVWRYMRGDFPIPQTRIFCGDGSKIDMAHVKRLEGAANVSVLTYPHVGHGVVRQMKDSGELVAVLREAAT